MAEGIKNVLKGLEKVGRLHLLSVRQQFRDLLDPLVGVAEKGFLVKPDVPWPYTQL